MEYKLIEYYIITIEYNPQSKLFVSQRSAAPTFTTKVVLRFQLD